MTLEESQFRYRLARDLSFWLSAAFELLLAALTCPGVSLGVGTAVVVATAVLVWRRARFERVGEHFRTNQLLYAGSLTAEEAGRHHRVARRRCMWLSANTELMLAAIMLSIAWWAALGAVLFTAALLHRRARFEHVANLSKARMLRRNELRAKLGDAHPGFDSMEDLLRAVEAEGGWDIRQHPALADFWVAADWLHAAAEAERQGPPLF